MVKALARLRFASILAALVGVVTTSADAPQRRPAAQFTGAVDPG